ncbi:hypothetical protein [Pseudomonas aeruginosa]|uniref:hypothetical protein n=1 Tax=Pseudomonas aeruginosa TaxID=287 RepID=UPI0005B95BBF|nr:hypothetical protein [Pseudomonas aeruginosa]ASP03632.1 hypothetical protein CGU46_01730 [Pseudomonas aeruginosa]ASP11398.1 hypothetical protein CGU45_08755 [Pseudomonas aeruginosa]EIU3493603.1 hypothetical protein [Pseudomonas aeruginosa]KYO81191.1 hypothetical protein LL05_04961 [Pseudomonas aeruginosa]MBK1801297.1 hypothetical protein [Pseudomonas aeruginosa]
MAAAKSKYIVISGCVQDGRHIYRKGEPYEPASAELREELLVAGVIGLAKDHAQAQSGEDGE